MTAGRRAVAFTPMETRREVIIDVACAAEELGYESIILPEGWGFDSTVLLTEIAMRTTRIKLVAGILSIWGRTPATMAMTAATLDQVSGGRFILGLGASTPELCEGFHDVDFEHPAAVLAETLVEVRRLLGGERAGIGESRTARPLRLMIPPVPELPIWVGSLGPRTIDVAATLADGWVPAYATHNHLAKVRGELNAKRERAGLRDSPLSIVCGPVVGIGDAESAKTTLAFYLCTMGDGYANFVTSQGFGVEVAALRAANPEPSPIRCDLPPEAQVLADQLMVSGDIEAVRDGLAHWDNVVDVLMVGMSPGDPWEAIQQRLEVCAPT